MLSDPSVDGIKTGHTLDAGYVLVALREAGGGAADLGRARRRERGRARRRLRGAPRLRLLASTSSAAPFERRRASSATADGPLRGRSARAASRRGPSRSRRRDDQALETERRRAGGGRGADRARASGSASRRSCSTASRSAGCRCSPRRARRGADVVDKVGGPGRGRSLIARGCIVILLVVAVLSPQGRGESGSERSPEERMRSREERTQQAERGRAMILTVTLNVALDRTVAVPRIALGTATARSTPGRVAGGKGVNVARALKSLGEPVIATGLAGGPDRRPDPRAARRRGGPARLRRGRRATRAPTSRSSTRPPASRPRSTSAARRSPPPTSSASPTASSTWPAAPTSA